MDKDRTNEENEGAPSYRICLDRNTTLSRGMYMGIYLNPGNENFKKILSREIYVDKSMMIERMNHFIDTGNEYVCVSRPRRFGKTFAGNML